MPAPSEPLPESPSAALRGSRLESWRGLLRQVHIDDAVNAALDAARAAEVAYADVRLVRRRGESLHAREGHVERCEIEESYGLGVRVIAGGSWGFAASSLVDGDEAARVARRAVEVARANARFLPQTVRLAPVDPVVATWCTPLERDPFAVPLQERAELLLRINREALKVKGVRFCASRFRALGEWRLFASSEGARVEQQVTRVDPGYMVTAVEPRLGFANRAHEVSPRQAGWEYAERALRVDEVLEVAEDAVAKLKAPRVRPGLRDLILAPSNLWLTIHESIGHATELDRVLGHEANRAGTSWATVAGPGSLRLAAEQLSFYADRTTPGGLATCGYDDEGVPAGRWDIVRHGMLVGFQTTRELAAGLGGERSRGACQAMDHRSFPIQRMPNLSLEPGDATAGVAELIGEADDAIYVTGRGSWSIDQQRHNFQFSGQMFYEVRKGRIVGPLRDVAYQSSSLGFWNRCERIGGASSWELHGTLTCGKGEPDQASAVSHGCPPARFRAIRVLDTGAGS